MLANALVFGFGSLIAALFYWVGTRPTVTPEEQDRLIEFGHK